MFSRAKSNRQLICNFHNLESEISIDFEIGNVLDIRKVSIFGTVMQVLNHDFQNFLVDVRFNDVAEAVFVDFILPRRTQQPAFQLIIRKHLTCFFFVGKTIFELNYQINFAQKI